MFFFKKRKDQEHKYLDAIANEIKSIIPECSDLVITPNTNLQDIGMDSIKFMKLLFRLEDISSKSIQEIMENLDPVNIKTVSDLEKLCK